MKLKEGDIINEKFSSVFKSLNKGSVIKIIGRAPYIYLNNNYVLKTQVIPDEMSGGLLIGVTIMADDIEELGSFWGDITLPFKIIKLV